MLIFYTLLVKSISNKSIPPNIYYIFFLKTSIPVFRKKLFILIFSEAYSVARVLKLQKALSKTRQEINYWVTFEQKLIAVTAPIDLPHNAILLNLFNFYT